MKYEKEKHRNESRNESPGTSDNSRQSGTAAGYRVQNNARCVVGAKSNYTLLIIIEFNKFFDGWNDGLHTVLSNGASTRGVRTIICKKNESLRVFNYIYGA